MSFVLELSFSSDRLSSDGFRFPRIVPFRRFDLAFDFVLPASFHDLRRSISSLAASLSSLLVVRTLGFSSFCLLSFLSPPAFFFFFFSFCFAFRIPLLPSGFRHDGTDEIGDLSRFGDRASLGVGMGCVGSTDRRHLAFSK